MAKSLSRMTPFEAWKVHLAVKEHFFSNYDIEKWPFAFKDKYRYGARLFMPIKYFEDGKEKKHFLKEMFTGVADRWSKPEFVALSVANAVTGHLKCGMPYGMPEIEVYHEWVGRQPRISYTFEQDLKTIENWREHLMSENSHPTHVRLYMGGHIQAETITILEMINPILHDYVDDFIIGDTCKIIQRYRPFVEFGGVNTKKLFTKHETLINNIARTRNSSNTMLI